LKQLDAMDDMAAIQARIDAFHAANPGKPVTWPALGAARVLSQVPVDPTGTPYLIDPSTGRIRVARESELWPMPGQENESR
jgi:hypothetical protein